MEYLAQWRKFLLSFKEKEKSRIVETRYAKGMSGP